jgi:hypothetical protein
MPVCPAQSRPQWWVGAVVRGWYIAAGVSESGSACGQPSVPGVASRFEATEVADGEDDA